MVTLASPDAFSWEAILFSWESAAAAHMKTAKTDTMIVCFIRIVVSSVM
jgi:hypothetical protein